MLLGSMQRSEVSAPKLNIQTPPSEIVGREDLMGRIAYEKLLVADPMTGEVPAGIRKAELLFAQGISKPEKRGRTQNLNVSAAGPVNVGGRTRAVAFDVRDEEIILAGGVSGGLWKSTDGGQNWERKSPASFRNSITCLAQDTRTGHRDTWYYGSGEIYSGSSTRGGGAPYRGDGIYKSVDNGESWTQIPSTALAEPNTFSSQFQYVFQIVPNAQNFTNDEVLVAAFGGILRSLDGGASWESVIGPEFFNPTDTTDLNNTNVSFYTDLQQASSGTFYAALSTTTAGASTLSRSPDAGFYFSGNGTAWERIPLETLPPFTSQTPYDRVVIGSSKSNPEITYFLVNSNPIFIVQHTLSQFDAQDTIQSLELRETPNFGGLLGDFNTQRSYNMMIKVHPEDPEIVFAGGTNLYRTTDGFRSEEGISWVGGYNPEGGASLYPGHHPDQHDLLFYPSNPNKVLSASDGGLRISPDATADSVMWDDINNGYITSQFYTIAQSKKPGDPTLIGGMQDNGTDLTSGSLSNLWKGLIGGDGSYAVTTRGALWFASFQQGQTLRLTLDDEFEITSFGRVDPGSLVEESGSQYLFINPFILDPTNENRAFFAGGSDLYFNGNISQIPGGSQIPTSLGWERVTESEELLGLVSALDISLDGQRLYFGTSGGELYKLDNAGSFTQFQLREITQNILPDRAYVSSISVNPLDTAHIVVAFSNYNIPSIFESTDGGRSFADISGNLEEKPDGSGNGPSIRWVELIPTENGNVCFAGTSTGLFNTEKTLGKKTIWQQVAPESIGSSVVTMMDYRASDGSLAIASHGNGIFRTFITDFKRALVPESEVQELSLITAYPNPFEDRVRIEFKIPEDDIVRIDLFTLKGELVNNILWAPQVAGSNSATWDGNNVAGISMANGIYLYTISYRNEKKSGRVLLRR